MKTLATMLTLIALAAATTAVALAHGDEEVGELKLVVGFLDEPAYEGEINAVSVRVTRVDDSADASHHSEDPTGVEGLERTLQVEVTYVPTDTSKIMNLQAAYNDPGHYVAVLIPTAPGHYRFRLFGTIEDEAIDETFESHAGGGEFDDVQPASIVHFPESQPSVRELESAIRGAQQTAQQAAQQAQLAQQAQAAQQAQLAADSDSDAGALLGIIGIIVGAVGVATGAAAIVMATRARSSAARP